MHWRGPTASRQLCLTRPALSPKGSRSWLPTSCSTGRYAITCLDSHTRQCLPDTTEPPLIGHSGLRVSGGNPPSHLPCPRLCQMLCHMRVGVPQATPRGFGGALAYAHVSDRIGCPRACAVCRSRSGRWQNWQQHWRLRASTLWRMPSSSLLPRRSATRCRLRVRGCTVLHETILVSSSTSNIHATVRTARSGSCPVMDTGVVPVWREGMS